MKQFLFFIFLSFANNCFSQTRLDYGDFIQTDSSIKWAVETDALVNLMPKTQKYSIKNYYLKKLKDSGINVFYLNSDRYSVTKGNLTYNDFKNTPFDTLINSNLTNESFYVILNTDSVNVKAKHKICICDSCSRMEMSEIFRVKQIVCYGNGDLSVKNVLISPLCLKSNDYQGNFSATPVWDILFNVAFNNCNKIKSQKQDLLYLGTENYNYDFNETSFFENNNKLTPRAPTLIRLILDDCKKGKLQIFDSEKGTVIPYKKLKNWRLEKVPVQVYDSLGIEIAIKYIMPERNFDSLNRFRIKQDFFYDRKNEILISTVKSIDILELVFTSTGINLGSRALFRFYPESKK